MFQKSVLIAGDDISDLMLLGAIINQVDRTLKVRMLGSGAQLLQLMAEIRDLSHVKLIILDYKTPAQDACALMEQIFRQDKFKNVSIIVWSSNHLEEYNRRILAAGAKGYYVKPQRASDLKALVRQMLSFCDGAGRP